MMGGWLVGGALLYAILSIVFSDEIAVVVMFAVFLGYGYVFIRVQKKAILEEKEAKEQEPEI